jgi:hypothetical protein
MNRRASEQRKEVFSMLILGHPILVLAALNLAVNAGLGTVISFHCPYPARQSHAATVITQRRYRISQRRRKEKQSMNRAWTKALVAFLVAAAETLIEVVKKLKKKGEAA